MAARVRRAFGLWFACACFGLLFSLTSPVSAQTAADKATARNLASEGIKQYDAGNYAEALDHLKRAQELFQAPVHLLYIARSQEKLGKLVEAAEAYQSLVHVELGASAPDVFVKAVEDGKKELEALQPRIPQVIIEAEPSEGSKLVVDGHEVPAAAIGAKMPINPGAHEAELSQEGYKTVKSKFEIAEGETKRVAMKLEAIPGYRKKTPQKPKDEAASAEAKSEEKEPLILGFMAGLRLSALTPGGKVGGNNLYIREGVATADDAKVTDYIGPGGGLELRGGARVLEHFVLLLYYQAAQLQAGDALKADPAGTRGIQESSAGLSSVGLGVLAETSLRKLANIRLFGEIDWAIQRNLKTHLRYEENSCEYDVTLNGGGFRFNVGASYPIFDSFYVGPHLEVGLGQFSSIHYERSANCTTADQVAATRDGKATIPRSDQKAHTLVGVGLGIEYLLEN